ncbi:DEAD/DEAH box helicase family protein [Polynucleobacter paneuropaeus]|nr:DEAD/DEAH box helicase family protein [Polynucleobacter paneuropaeus]
MKLKFKNQQYQTNAVEAVTSCFIGQSPSGAVQYRLDPGNTGNGMEAMFDTGFKNADFTINNSKILENITEVQRTQNLPVSENLVSTKACHVNLDVEMETGTGKTYCYIKTVFELNKLYGWSKFVIVVPSIAIREGVYKSLQITADHFLEGYGKKARFFIYNSKQLHNLESYSSDAGINIMVINVQAFNATGKDARRIYEELDDFQSRRPIDVIKGNRPIMILDEPQKMEGAKTLDSLKEFNPLFMLRYSATHKTTHNKIHRLDALDAYNQKLVKKISVRGISVKGLSGTNSYLYLEDIQVSATKSPEARIEFEIKQNNGIKRVVRKLSKGKNLFDESNELDQYRDGFVISDINANTDTVSFTNGIEISAGEATGDVNVLSLRRIQIREAIKAHFEKERFLFNQDIKVLTLFFIDEVVKYRDYSQDDEQGEYARIFEEEYNNVLNEVLTLEDTAYNRYLHGIQASQTHSGYFSIDKKTKHLVDPETGKKSTETDDVDAYELILKDKERLLSFAEPVRFIFSHSALREGWDNPNVFVICTLKHNDNTISRRQEVGRGMRLSVNQMGDRMDDPATVHQVNVLTVVASESYKDFVTALQRDISESLSERPRVADESYFAGKILKTNAGSITVTPLIAKQIYKYLVKNDYTDDLDRISEKYHEDKKNDLIAGLPIELQPYADQVFALIETVFNDAQLPTLENDRGSKINPLNSNFEKKEFKELWGRINRKAAYSVHFDSNELVAKCISTLDAELRMTPLQYTVQRGEQLGTTTYDEVKSGDAFKLVETETANERVSAHSSVRYDLVGKIAEATQLTRATIVAILGGVNKPVFAQFKTNPESFIAECGRFINEQKATCIIEHLSYDSIAEVHDIDIFTETQFKQDFSKAGDALKRHIYDYVVTDSKIEREFVKELDTSSDVVVYAKLPKGFFIPTPVGNYNPDWAITFKEGSVKHIYFVAETKGSMSSMDLREIEKSKIECAKKFFEGLNKKIDKDKVKYDVINSFGKLMEIVN